MLTLDEAIKHCYHRYNELRNDGCDECASEHKQLAEWLSELKDIRTQLKYPNSTQVSELKELKIEIEIVVKWIMQ